MLEIKNVSKSFPGVKALNNVSVQFQNGEIHALLGENGAGKSTLMKIICGIYKADEGNILNFIYQDMVMLFAMGLAWYIRKFR